MESCVLNDVEYDFKPLESFVTDPDYKVDEKELKRRIERGFPKYKCDRFVFYKNEKYYEHLDYQGNVISKIYGKGG